MAKKSVEKQSFPDMLLKKGLVDERGAAVCATASRLPNGEFGMVLLAVKGHILYIHDVDMKGNPLEHLYTISLKEVADLKINAGFFAEFVKGYALRFTHKKFTYTFKNCSMKKDFLAAVRDEVEGGRRGKALI